MSTTEFSIADLGTQAIEGSDAAYEAPSEFYRPVEMTPKGERETIILDHAPQGEIGGDNSEFYFTRDFATREIVPGFSTNLKFTIVGGKQDEKSFFAFIDTKKKRDRNGNDVEDFLRASGFTGRLFNVNDYHDAMKTTALVPVQARITWRPEKCQVCDKRTVKLKDFDTRADGTKAHTATCPDCGELVGARAAIQMFFVK